MGKRAKKDAGGGGGGWKEGLCAAETVEGMTKQGEVDRSQTPPSRPGAQEVVHIRKRLPAPRVHARGSPRLEHPTKGEPPGHAALDRTRRPCRGFGHAVHHKDFVSVTNLSCLTHVHIFRFFCVCLKGALCQTGVWLSHWPLSHTRCTHTHTNAKPLS